MRISNSMRWLVVVAEAVMLLAVAAACSAETVEVPGETVVVEKEVVRTVEVPGETVTVEVVKEVQVPGETVVVEKVVTETVEVPGETVVVKEEVVKTVEVPGETVTVEVVKEVMVPGETVVVEKEVVKTVEVPGETVVVEKEVVKTVEVPGETVVVEKEVVKEVVKTVEVPGGKTYVTDPTTGKTVEAPRYGGTLTYATAMPETGGSDAVVNSRSALMLVQGVLEKPAISDWAIDRNLTPRNSSNTPLWTLTGSLAESWETPDDTTIVLNIRKGVHWHDKAPMNGREFTADDMVFNYHRYLGLGSGFTEIAASGVNLGTAGIESVTASDKYTVVFKLERPHLFALNEILQSHHLFMHPPEVIKEHGDANDWRNLVGTGPFMLTDYVEGSSITFTKNPNYYGFDEKYPENRLPYVDELAALIMKEPATRLAALRSGKLDYLGYVGNTQIKTIDQVESLARTNPEIAQWPFVSRSDFGFAINVNNPVLNDIRVRKAMQMALDLETINTTFFSGRADTTPHGYVGEANTGFFIPFDEWPEEVKKGYMYDPEGAEKLLDEAGYPRGADGIRFKTSYLHSPSSETSYAELALSYWGEIGVDVEMQVPSSQTEFTAIASAAKHEALRWKELGAHYFGEFLVDTYYTGANWNPGAISDPQVDAMIDTLRVTTDLEEYQRLFREIDMYAIEKHWFIWGPDSPSYHVSQPWFKGYNGEAVMGNWHLNPLLARIWIDQELKEAMGY